MEKIDTKPEYIHFYRTLYQLKKERQEQKGKIPFVSRLFLIVFFTSMCILLPLFSLFFFIIWRNDHPKAAKWLGWGTLIGFIINMSIELLPIIFSGLL